VFNIVNDKTQMGNIINIIRIKFFQEGMKRLYQIKTLLICALFLSPLVIGDEKAHAQELLEINPKTTTCGQKLTIKAGVLDKTKAYTLGVECTDFACTNPPGFSPLTYAIPLGSVAFTKEESFNVNAKCSTGLVKAPAGTYTVKLIEGESKKVITTDEFELEDKSPTTCLITIDPIIEATQDASYSIQGKAGCKYKVSVINPVGMRQPVEEIEIPAGGTYNGTLAKTIIAGKGKYTIAGIADASCSDISVDDKECAVATTKVIDGSCIYSQQDKRLNCEQCAKGKACTSSGTCAVDTTGGCTKNTPEKAGEQENTGVSKVKNSNTNIVTRLSTAGPNSLFGIFIGMVIFGLIGYKVLAYRFRKD
jgi:hypothetical protein